MLDRFYLFSFLLLLLFSSCENGTETSSDIRDQGHSFDFPTFDFRESKTSKTLDSLFSHSRHNYSNKTSTPHLYQAICLDNIEVKSEKDKHVKELIRFLNFEKIDINIITANLLNFEKEALKYHKLLKHTYFILTEYFQNIEFDEKDAIKYSTKLLSLSKKYSEVDFYYFKALENLVNLEVINRDNISSSSYAVQYLESASIYHPDNKVLKAKALCLNGYAFSRREKLKKALDLLAEALKVLPEKECLYDKQEILKIILFICNSYNFKNQERIYQKYFQILKNEIQQCGDFCNINKIIAEQMLRKGNSELAIPFFLKSYDYILNNHPIDYAQLGTVLYYLHKAYLNLGMFEEALNTCYTESLMPPPKKIAAWDRTKIFEDKKKGATFYFMTIGYYTRVFYEKYKYQKNIKDLLFAKELLDSSRAYIKYETHVNDEDRLLSLFKNSEEVYDLGLLINNELYKTKGNKKHLSDLYQCSEESKLKILYSLIHRKSKNHSTGIQIQKSIDSLVLLNENSDDIIKMKNIIDSLGISYNYKKEEGLLSKVQSSLDKDELLIDYNIINEELFIHYIYSDTSILYSSIFAQKEDSIVNTLISAQKDLKFEVEKFQSLAQTVFKILFPNPNLPYRITIIPDQHLLNLNFETLRNETSQDLIDNHMIVYSGSGHQYVCTPDLTVEKDKNIVAFFYSDERSINEAPITLKQLPGNISEKKLIESSFPNAGIFSGKTNSKDQFLMAITQNSFDIIHIGTHGYSSIKDVKDIRLYFRDHIYRLDSIYAYHLLDQELDANLVILSACHSGAGLYFGGEGKFDWARYFILSGAKSVISSLWEVDDRASKLLFNSFYKSNEATYKEKIREAKIKLKNNPDYNHPYFWGGFIYSS